MLSKWSWIVFNFIIYVSTAPRNKAHDEAKAFLELLQLEYEDICNSTVHAQWSFIVSPSNRTLLTWKEQQYEYAKIEKQLRSDIIGLKKKNQKGTNQYLQYKYNVIEKPGDALLNAKDWKQLVDFAGVVELQQSTNKSQNYSREDVEYLLSHNGKAEIKQAAWDAWYHHITPLVANYSNNLLFVAEAAQKNDAENVQEYWELLSGYPGGYDKINSEWSRINSLHKKIINFINANFAQKYEITANDTLPYLLGNLQGYDWTDIPSDVLPYSELVYDIKKNLWKKKCVGKSLYKTASNLGTILLKQVPQAEFWDNSEFNGQCPSRLLNFCRGKMRVSTCSKASVSSFLRAHEDVGKILFNQITEESTPVLNIVNRYSGLEESVSTLFGILSASPAWLKHTRLMNNTDNQEKHMVVSLMLTALNVLPRLAYYYSADLWRINAIDKNITDPIDLMSSWWKYRQEYEGMSSINTDSPTFLDDSYIVTNKPYLPKILGIILAFQLYEYTLESTEVRYDNITGKFINSKIIKMIQQGGADDWQVVLNEFLDIDDILVDSLISYFTPLEVFIEENEDFEYKSGATADKELEELEKHILKEINTPSTTPAPTTTTTTITNQITTKSSLYKKMSNEKNMQTKVEKSLDSKSSVFIQEDKPKKFDTNSSVDLAVNKSSTSSDAASENTPKINTRKTIWALSAILIAIIVICIIAIFGRRRCLKTPKNRRYV